MRHRNGAHQHAGTDSPEQVGNLVKQFSDGCAPGTIGNVALQDAHLRAHRRLLLKSGKRGGKARIQFVAGQLPELCAHLLQSLNFLFKQKAVESRQLRLAVENQVGIGAIEALAESLRHIGRSDVAALNGLNKLLQAELSHFGALLIICRPVMKHRQIFQPAVGRPGEPLIASTLGRFRQVDAQHFNHFGNLTFRLAATLAIGLQSVAAAIAEFFNTGFKPIAKFL